MNSSPITLQTEYDEHILLFVMKLILIEVSLNSNLMGIQYYWPVYPHIPFLGFNQLQIKNRKKHYIHANMQTSFLVHYFLNSTV